MPSSIEIPSNYSLQYSREDIDKRVSALGQEIGEWANKVYQEKGQPILAVCVLRGAVLFFADLIRAVPLSVEPTFCRTWSYSSKENAQLKGVSVSVDSIEAADRSILIIDDICDTGATLKKLNQVFLELGAAEVKTAVLIHRLIDDVSYEPDYSCFRFDGKEWFVGYGMEDRNRCQNLSDVYIINPSA